MSGEGFRCDADSIRRFFGTDGWHDFEVVMRQRLHGTVSSMTNMPMSIKDGQGNKILTSEAFRNLQGAAEEQSAVIGSIKENMMSGVHLGISIEEDEGGEE